MKNAPRQKTIHEDVINLRSGDTLIRAAIDRYFQDPKQGIEQTYVMIIKGLKSKADHYQEKYEQEIMSRPEGYYKKENQ